MTECVRLSNLCKVYDNGFAAVRDATLMVGEGEFLVLVGPSGCGKSTLLRMIAGLESITSGELHIGGRLVNTVAPKDRDIAMVFQNYALYPHLTVFDNMAFGLKLRKHSRSDIRERVQAAAEILGLEEILGSRPKELSGGQRQRVAVGRAIVRQPKVFLFDEPLSNLDAKLRVQMRAEIRALHQRLGTTMVYVTHDQVEAMTMGDRIVVMQAGRMEQIDTPLGLYDRPVNRFVAEFIGSPAMNLFEGSVGSSNRGMYFHERGGGIELSLPRLQESLLDVAVGDEIVLGVRPEDIYLAATVPTPSDAPASPVVARSSDQQGRKDSSGNLPPTAETALTVPPGLIEQMGNEMMIHASTTTGALVARVARQAIPGPGEWVRLAFDTTKLHFFRSHDGTRIGNLQAGTP